MESRSAVGAAAQRQGGQGPQVPLTEVVYGAHFVAPDFSVVHFGEYFDRIRNRFPRHRDVVPIAKQAQTPDEMQVPTLPRVWYESDDRLIQLQIDRFLYNWRHLGGGDVNYPGFERLLPEFQQEWRAFLDFANECSTVPLHLDELNLTYIDHIERVDSLSTPIFSFRENEWRREFPEPEFWLSQFRFAFPNDNLKLTVAARPAIQLTTQKRVTSFELIIQSIRPPESSDFAGIESWFRAAHERMHWSFERLVRPEWRAQWGFD